MKRHATSRRDFLRNVALGSAAIGGLGRCGAVGQRPAEAGQPPPERRTVQECPRRTPVVYECDLCVVGGSSTGVFAAIRAARLGATVALVESNGFFGGVATAAKVNVWHSTYDTAGRQQIIGGLTVELIERLAGRGEAIVHKPSNPNQYATFNSAEMILELDRLVCEHETIRPFLHALFVGGLVEDGRMTHAILEDKSGRRAIAAKYFIDATGDGDLLWRIGLPTRKDDVLQPPTTCMLLGGLGELKQANPGFNLAKAIYNPEFAGALRHGFVWTAPSVGFPGVEMIAGTRVWGADCSDADELTRAEIEGRRQVRAIRDILHDNFAGGQNVSVGALPARIGVRETRHGVCRYRLTETDVLEGRRFDDAIANGSYRVDVHHPDKEGLTFRYLDGREVYVVPGKTSMQRRWRPPRDTDPTFYQVPYRSLVPQGSRNVLLAGRLLDADRGAFGGVRVMVNCNQMGEAAGTACCLAMHEGLDVADVDVQQLRQTLAAGGSVIL